MSKIRDDIIIQALLSEPSVTAAARVARCSRETIYQRMRKPGFMNKLNSEIDARYEAIRAQGTSATIAAVEALQDVLNNPLRSNTRDLLRAAELALKYLNRGGRAC